MYVINMVNVFVVFRVFPWSSPVYAARCFLKQDIIKLTIILRNNVRPCDFLSVCLSQSQSVKPFVVQPVLLCIIKFVGLLVGNFGNFQRASELESKKAIRENSVMQESIVDLCSSLQFGWINSTLVFRKCQDSFLIGMIPEVPHSGGLFPKNISLQNFTKSFLHWGSQVATLQWECQLILGLC